MTSGCIGAPRGYDDPSADTSTDASAADTVPGGPTEPTEQCEADGPKFRWPKSGEPVPHVTGIDGDGEPFELCRLAGRPFVVDISTVWCGPCNQLGAYLAGDDSQDFINDPEIGPPLRDLVNAGEIGWVTMLTQDVDGNPATAAHATQWEHDYPNANVVVFVPDNIAAVEKYLSPVLFPAIHTVDHEFDWLYPDNWANWNQLAAILACYGDP